MKRSSPYTARPRAFRPILEQLETRLVPAMTLQQLDLDGDGSQDDIRIRGDGGNNTVQIFDTADNGFVLAMDANGDGDFDDAPLGDLPGVLFGISDKSVVFDINLGGGADKVIYSVNNNDRDGCARTLLVRLGTGDDEFRANAGTQNLVGLSAFHFDVNGGGGADAVDFAFKGVTNSSLVIKEALGGGNDTSAVTFAGNIDFGASVKILADLGPGDNLLDLALQGVGFNDVATADINVLGGDDALHHDKVTVDLHDDVGNGVLSSRLAITARLRAGDDEFLVRPQTDDFRVDDTSLAAIAAFGGAGRDELKVVGTDPAAFPMHIDPDGLFDIDLHGGDGADVLAVDFAITNALRLEGTLRVRLHGDADGDELALFVRNDDTTRGTYDLAVAGGDGDDLVRFGLDKQLGSPGLGPAAAVLLAGGSGTDTLTDLNPEDSKAVQFEKTT
jgi:hypothetical protein